MLFVFCISIWLETKISALLVYRNSFARPIVIYFAQLLHILLRWNGAFMGKIKIVKSKNKQKDNKVLHLKRLTPQLIAQALVVVAIAGVFIFAMPNLPQRPTTDANATYQGVINLWLVDSFEGGSGSRQSWFTKRSAQFESQNKGVFVCVTALTESQLLAKLADGQKFDLLCFSRGVGAKVLQNLAPMDVDFGCVLDNFAQSGRVHNSTYAVPIFAGTYCVFARKSQQNGDVLANCLTTTFKRKVGKNTITLAPLVCGFSVYNSPLTALAKSGVKGAFQPDYSTTQYTAYEQFVANKSAVTLLGTQRDMYRLGKKLELGKMEELLFAPLTAYTDLVSYVGISKHTSNLSICQKYVQYLLTDTVQQSVRDISMFSVTCQNLYTNEWYSACESGLATAIVPYVFADEEAILDARSSALKEINSQ